MDEAREVTVLPDRSPLRRRSEAAIELIEDFLGADADTAAARRALREVFALLMRTDQALSGRP